MGTGLRESKKLRTRQEIAERAMGLFAARGFDHVTVAEVAAAAGVSEKTVFNYFPTKEDLFFDEAPAREAALVEAICGRKPHESILSALRDLQIAECPRRRALAVLPQRAQAGARRPARSRRRPAAAVRPRARVLVARARPGDARRVATVRVSRDGSRSSDRPERENSSVERFRRLGRLSSACGGAAAGGRAVRGR